MTEQELIVKINKGDTAAFRWLYREYYIALCTYAKKFTHDAMLAEEVVQNTFFKIWENRKSIIIRESLVAYLYRSVQNNCLNHLKHLQIVNRFNEYYSKKLREAEEYYTITQETGQSLYIAKELENKIYDAIEKLPEQCREIFKLSRFEYLKNSEIAEKKGVTLNTVQKQISIALAKLREALSPFLTIVIAIFLK